MKKIYLLLCSIACTGFCWSETLTLEQALDLALKNSPRIRAAEMRALAAEKAAASVGLWKNPILNMEAEGIGGDLDGVDEAEFSVVMKQTVQRGGKRALDRQIAGKAVAAASQAGEERMLELMEDVRRAFFDVFAQQETGRVRAEQEQLARAFVSVAKKRYEAGGVSELDVVQAELALEEVLLSQTCCFGDLQAARIELASLLGVQEADLKELAGPYYELEELSARQLAETHPTLKRMDVQIEMLQAEAARAGASDTSDITFGAGVKHEAGGDTHSFVLSASLPLNIVRGGRVRQTATLAESEALVAEREEVRRDLQQQLSKLLAVYGGTKMEVEMILGRLLPKAQQAYEVTRAGYDAGRFSWMELIDAQQHLAEVRVRAIETLRDAHFARADIFKRLGEEF